MDKIRVILWVTPQQAQLLIFLLVGIVTGITIDIGINILQALILILVLLHILLLTHPSMYKQKRKTSNSTTIIIKIINLNKQKQNQRHPPKKNTLRPRRIHNHCPPYNLRQTEEHDLKKNSCPMKIFKLPIMSIWSLGRRTPRRI